MFCFINFSAIFQNFSDFTLGTPHGPVAYDDFGSSVHGKVHQKRAAHIRPSRDWSFIPCINIHICCGRVPQDAHRKPNIIHFYAQGTQYNTYRARALPQETHQKKTRAYKYIFLIIINSLRNNGWAACG